MSRLGRIVYLCEITGRGALTDYTYPEKLYKFIATDYQAGQYVLYTTTDLNPVTGHRECDLIAPKLWTGLLCITTVNQLNGFTKNNENKA